MRARTHTAVVLVLIWAAVGYSNDMTDCSVGNPICPEIHSPKSNVEVATYVESMEYSFGFVGLDQVLVSEGSLAREASFRRTSVRVR